MAFPLVLTERALLYPYDKLRRIKAKAKGWVEKKGVRGDFFEASPKALQGFSNLMALMKTSETEGAKWDSFGRMPRAGGWHKGFAVGVVFGLSGVAFAEAPSPPASTSEANAEGTSGSTSQAKKEEGLRIGADVGGEYQLRGQAMSAIPLMAPPPSEDPFRRLPGPTLGQRLFGEQWVRL
ncbi:MAG: hypothetical protein N2515_07085, partial [Deltaproteobacteria bacterium]|nr:hypothetical protein [Deltaproteobacteria bacterium]